MPRSEKFHLWTTGRHCFRHSDLLASMPQLLASNILVYSSRSTLEEGEKERIRACSAWTPASSGLCFICDVQHKDISLTAEEAKYSARASFN